MSEFTDLPVRDADLALIPDVTLDGQGIPETLSDRATQLLSQNAKMKKTWESSEYPSTSEQAFALMYYCGLYGLEKAEAAAVHVALYASLGRKADGERKTPSALRAWLKGCEQATQDTGEGGDPTRLTSPDDLDFVSVQTFYTKPIVTRPHLVQDLIQPNRINFLTADPKRGKTLFATHLAGQLARGQKVLDHYAVPDPAVVLYIQEEDPEDMVIPRLRQLFTPEQIEDMGDRFRIVIESGIHLDDPTWRQWLERRVQEHRPRLAILDVWRQIAGVNLNKEEEVRPILRYLTQLRKQYDLSHLIITHDPKPKADARGGDRVRITGTGAQWAWGHAGASARKESGSAIWELPIGLHRL